MIITELRVFVIECDLLACENMPHKIYIAALVCGCTCVPYHDTLYKRLSSEGREALDRICERDHECWHVDVLIGGRQNDDVQVPLGPEGSK